MKLWMKYIRQRHRGILTGVLFCVIFTISFVLYGLPVKAVWYPAALSRQLTNDLFRIEQYVEMVLTFLRLHSESTDYVIREYDLDSIIRQSVKKFAGEFISRKLSLVYEPLHMSVLTDEKWLSFVIEQVLSNALKYTPSGSISITVESGNRLCIRDTGIGIAPDDLPRIFEHGYTGYNGRADKKASGIGLYLLLMSRTPVTLVMG